MLKGDLSAKFLTEVAICDFSAGIFAGAENSDDFAGSFPVVPAPKLSNIERYFSNAGGPVESSYSGFLVSDVDAGALNSPPLLALGAPNRLPPLGFYSNKLFS